MSKDQLLYLKRFVQSKKIWNVNLKTSWALFLNHQDKVNRYEQTVKYSD